VLQTEAR